MSEEIPAAPEPVVASPPAPETTAPPGEPPAEQQEEKVPEKPANNPAHTKAFRALTLKERGLRQQEQGLKEREARVVAMEAARQRARTNPIEWLQQADITYEDVAKYVLSEGKEPVHDPRVQALEERLKQTESALEERVKREEEERNNQQIQKFIASMRETVDSNGDRFELVRSYGDEAIQEAYRLVEMHFRQYGTVLEREEALDRIEEVLLEKKEAEAKRLLALPRFRTRLGLDQAEAKASPRQPPSPPATGAKTISDELSASSTATVSQHRPLTDDEEWEAVIARARARG